MSGRSRSPNDLPGLYTSSPDATSYIQRHRDTTTTDDTDIGHSLQNTLEWARSTLANQYDSLQDYIPHYTPDAVPEDDQLDSSFPTMAMARAYIYKLIAPDFDDFDLLEFRLDTNPEWAERMGFDPDQTPDRTTFSTQWWERYNAAMRRHLEYEAARAAIYAQDYGFDVSEKAEELIAQFDRSQDDEEIPENRRLENEERDRVFNEFRDLFNDVLDYNRGQNKSIPAEDLTELATFSGRRNETVQGGRDVYVTENAVSDDEYMCAEALAKPIREYSRKLAEREYARRKPLPPNERAYDWSLHPEECAPRLEDRDYGEGERWHDRTERGIGQQVEMLQDRGMLDRPVDICIDGTAREYNNRSDTDVEEPDGVLHRYPKYETGYAWEDITVTAIYRGRAIVLASISKVKADERFQCVRYLIDRARDLVNVRNVYADSEFGTQRICSYITQCGMDYVMKKRKTRGKVKEFLSEEAEGRADWKDYEIEGEDHTKHKTTLLALESTSKSVTKKGEQRKQKEADDDTEQSQLAGTNVDPVEDDEEDDADSDGDDDEEDEEEDEIELESFITSFTVHERGLEPYAEGPRREEKTAFGVGQLYRKRWAIETAFRDVKKNFKAKPRSRCLGVRRFYWMLCVLLYNCWAILNIIVAEEVDDREEDEIIWRKKIFIIDIHNEVFADREFG